MKQKIIIFVILSLVSINLSAQSEKKMVREGNSQFEDGNFSEAEIEYRKALDKKPGYFKGTFNLGDAMYVQENYEESGKLFAEVAEGVHPDELKAGAWYNLGNSLMKEQNFKESIEAYKNSLRLKPDDQDAKYNLAYARKKLDEQQQQQDQNQDKNKDKDKKDQDKDKDKDKQDQNKDQDKDKQDQDKKDQDKKDQNQDKKDDQQKDQQPQPQQISKEDAQRMLEALKNDEKKTLEELQKQKAKVAKSRKTEIDW